MMMEIIPHVDVLVAGTEDIFSLEPDKERSVQRVQREFFGMARPSSLCILKAGRDGAHWRDDLSTWHHVSAIPIKIRSTTGAGDAFNAGVLFALRQGKTFEEAVIFANAVAAKIVESDQSTLSTSEAIDSISFF